MLLFLPRSKYVKTGVLLSIAIVDCEAMMIPSTENPKTPASSPAGSAIAAALCLALIGGAGCSR